MHSASKRDVFITGGTGYMGRRLIAALTARGHHVTAVARPASANKLPPGCEVIIGDVLNATSWKSHLRPGHTVVHLVGVAHPSPAKAREFVEIDLRSLRETVAAASAIGIEHLVYVSVAQPAPAMKAYVAVRAECEVVIREARLNSTILRPWYVLGPGHWWPLALIPAYKLAELLPQTSEGATRLGLVWLSQMVRALTHTVENPIRGIKIIDVPGIRATAGLPGV